MRLATITTARGPRLHVKARSGYVDVGEATGDERMSALQYVLEAGEPALDRGNRGQPHSGGLLPLRRATAPQQ